MVFFYGQVCFLECPTSFSSQRTTPLHSTSIKFAIWRATRAQVSNPQMHRYCNDKASSKRKIQTRITARPAPLARRRASLQVNSKTWNVNWSEKILFQPIDFGVSHTCASTSRQQKLPGTAMRSMDVRSTPGGMKRVDGFRPTAPKAWEAMSQALRRTKVKALKPNEVAGRNGWNRVLVDVRPREDYQEVRARKVAEVHAIWTKQDETDLGSLC